jgi:hypothetical protein
MSPEAFISRWSGASGSELANAQSFTRELCELLGVPPPDPAQADTRDNAYVFERRILFRHGDGATSEGRADCYRRGAFVLEAKKIKLGPATGGFSDAMLRARSQAESYARALPAAEGRPPFLMVVDVGHVIELYAEFSRSGATYIPFPDPRSHRIRITDLADAAVRERLAAVWLDPLSLDPARIAGKVTREISDQLAGVAKSLEQAGHAPELAAAFLSRCLFCFFAEDVGLLPRDSFTDLLESFVAPVGAGLPATAASESRASPLLQEGAPEQFIPLLTALWREMDVGGFSVVLRRNLLRFNGKLFKQPVVLPLNRDQIGLLVKAGRKDWTLVEPAIFGTLLERALNPAERHSLGAHYTPRAYVERLVLPTVIEPLRGEWANAQAAAVLLANEGKLEDARREVLAFHHRLCQVRVLDPACGSANFLYVTLEHMKRLEGEVLNQLDALGPRQGLLESAGLTVDPHQFLGLELNPRAAAIAELVLWIGYLQWHFRTLGSGRPPQPVLKDFHNIECRDAVLAYDIVEFATDEAGKLLSRWDGLSFKPHPVTLDPVPDEAARVPLERYVNPRPATWPEADFVVGNPPFIGAASLRRALGDGYAEALRAAWPQLPESADFVMVWWLNAGLLARQGKIRRFGFITTNSLKQVFNRRVLEALMQGEHVGASLLAKPGADQASIASKLAPTAPPLRLAFAIPDHPWVDAADGAAVRIAMTVGDTGTEPGRLFTVAGESQGGEDSLEVSLTEKIGRINADLTVGADLNRAAGLIANARISGRGFQLMGAGFIVTPTEAAALGLGTLPGLESRIRPYRNGRDLTDRPRGVLVIDLFGLAAEDVRRDYPAVYQWLLERVKPERDQNNRASYRDNWWVFGEPRRELRPALASLPRYIATVETAKHRTFQFLDASIAPDNMLIAIASNDAYHLGVLSSIVHVTWALAAGGRLGVGNDPRYNKSRCFEPFPFPDATPEQEARIRDLAEELDAHRKRQQAAHPELTLTGMYNVLEKLRTGEMLSAKEKAIHAAGLVSVLKSLHDDLDRAVLDAYGWSDLLEGSAVGWAKAEGRAHADGGHAALCPPYETVPSDTLLERLVALNAARAAEEARGRVRWLRPEFQNPGATQARMAEVELPQEVSVSTPASAETEKHPWPATLPEQVALVARVLAESSTPLTEPMLTARFTGRGAWKKRLSQLLETLVALGRARKVGEGYSG